MNILIKSSKIKKCFRIIRKKYVFNPVLEIPWTPYGYNRNLDRIDEYPWNLNAEGVAQDLSINQNREAQPLYRIFKIAKKPKLQMHLEEMYQNYPNISRAHVNAALVLSNNNVEDAKVILELQIKLECEQKRETGEEDEEISEPLNLSVDSPTSTQKEDPIISTPKIKIISNTIISRPQNLTSVGPSSVTPKLTESTAEIRLPNIPIKNGLGNIKTKPKSSIILSNESTPTHLNAANFRKENVPVDNFDPADLGNASNRRKSSYLMQPLSTCDNKPYNYDTLKDNPKTEGSIRVVDINNAYESNKLRSYRKDCKRAIEYNNMATSTINGVDTTTSNPHDTPKFQVPKEVQNIPEGDTRNRNSAKHCKDQTVKDNARFRELLRYSSNILKPYKSSKIPWTYNGVDIQKMFSNANNTNPVTSKNTSNASIIEPQKLSTNGALLDGLTNKIINDSHVNDSQPCRSTPIRNDINLSNINNSNVHSTISAHEGMKTFTGTTNDWTSNSNTHLPISENGSLNIDKAQNSKRINSRRESHAFPRNNIDKAHRNARLPNPEENFYRNMASHVFNDLKIREQMFRQEMAKFQNSRSSDATMFPPPYSNQPPYVPTNTSQVKPTNKSKRQVRGKNSLPGNLGMWCNENPVMPTHEFVDDVSRNLRFMPENPGSAAYVDQRNYILPGQRNVNVPIRDNVPLEADPTFYTNNPFNRQVLSTLPGTHSLPYSKDLFNQTPNANLPGGNTIRPLNCASSLNNPTRHQPQLYAPLPGNFENPNPNIYLNNHSENQCRYQPPVNLPILENSSIVPSVCFDNNNLNAPMDHLCQRVANTPNSFNHIAANPNWPATVGYRNIQSNPYPYNPENFRGKIQYMTSQEVTKFPLNPNNIEPTSHTPQRVEHKAQDITTITPILPNGSMPSNNFNLLQNVHCSTNDNVKDVAPPAASLIKTPSPVHSPNKEPSTNFTPACNTDSKQVKLVPEPLHNTEQKPTLSLNTSYRNETISESPKNIRKPTASPVGSETNTNRKSSPGSFKTDTETNSSKIQSTTLLPISNRKENESPSFVVDSKQISLSSNASDSTNDPSKKTILVKLPKELYYQNPYIFKTVNSSQPDLDQHSSNSTKNHVTYNCTVVSNMPTRVATTQEYQENITTSVRNALYAIVQHTNDGSQDNFKDCMKLIMLGFEEAIVAYIKQGKIQEWSKLIQEGYANALAQVLKFQNEVQRELQTSRHKEVVPSNDGVYLIVPKFPQDNGNANTRTLQNANNENEQSQNQQIISKDPEIYIIVSKSDTSSTQTFESTNDADGHDTGHIDILSDDCVEEELSGDLQNESVQLVDLTETIENNNCDTFISAVDSLNQPISPDHTSSTPVSGESSFKDLQHESSTVYNFSKSHSTSNKEFRSSVSNTRKRRTVQSTDASVDELPTNSAPPPKKLKILISKKNDDYVVKYL